MWSSNINGSASAPLIIRFNGPHLPQIEGTHVHTTRWVTPCGSALNYNVSSQLGPQNHTPTASASIIYNIYEKIGLWHFRLSICRTSVFRLVPTLHPPHLFADRPCARLSLCEDRLVSSSGPSHLIAGPPRFFAGPLQERLICLRF